MVALLHQGHAPERVPGHLAARAEARPVARVDARPGRRAPFSSPSGSRAHLRLVVDQAAPPDGAVSEVGHRVTLRSVSSAPAGPSIGGVSVVAVVVVGVVVFGLLGLVRGVQSGGLTAGDAAGEAGSVSVGVDAAAGDRLVVVAPGDSLWSIASELAPDRDPRPLVEALAEVNGGTSLQIGQQIVIPGSLLE